MRRNRIVSRRKVLDSAVRLVGAIPAWGFIVPRSRAEENAEEKVSQAEAKYQNQPKSQQRCEICLQFQPPSTCKIVNGRISQKGWCQFFAARENAR
jgi:hypothetical protein